MSVIKGIFMALFTISDLHLSLGTDKPMDIFSQHWEGHAEKIRRNWMEIVNINDTIIIPGDISWATYLDHAIEDFKFLNALPGRKIISKGNHDYWWETASKMNRFLQEKHLQNIYFLHNNFYTYDEWAICGTRGWSVYEKAIGEDPEKIFNREYKRLELSLDQARKKGYIRIIAVSHYPPFKYDKFESGFIDIMRNYGVRMCLYGHLHGEFSYVRQGIIDGIEYKFVSADYLNFKPQKLI